MNHPVKESAFEKHVQTIMLAVITAAAIAMVSFLWNLNAKIAAMEERDRGKTETINNLQQSMNRMQLDMLDIKDRVTRIEANKEKP
jgi:hypothetical protein